MLLTELGISTERNEPQPGNAHHSMLFTEFGIVNDTKFLTLLNDPYSIVSTVEGITNVLPALLAG